MIRDMASQSRASIAQWFVDILAALPPEGIILFIAMVPLVELRGTILLWSAQGGGFALAGFPYPDGWVQIYAFSVLGNMIPIPFILYLFPWVEKKLRRFAVFTRFFDWLFARTRRKTNKSVERYQELALLLFVAIPLPITGAWTGSLVSYLFGLDRMKSLLFIFLGVLTAGAIMLVLVMISLWVAIGIIGALTAVLVLLGRLGTEKK
ncbi:MAG: small multi-drug export protein [Candidatus Thermoplasmatota archaeon]|nr:small multi-drug export protein [Candidatus Thermoplasmatota archaeon]